LAVHRRQPYAVRLPKTKCKISEMMAKTSNKWINPLATCMTVNPPIHAISNITNRIVQILIVSSFVEMSSQAPATAA
jgi:hypothetical protein